MHFDDDVDFRMRNQALPVVTEMGVALCQADRPSDAAANCSAFQPTRSRLALAPVRRQIGDAGQMHTRRPGHLGEVHGREFAGADQADAQRPALGLALLQFAEEIHACSTDEKRKNWSGGEQLSV